MKEVIAFIGLGNMGWNMAGHLARSGFEVLGFDQNPEIRDRFAAEHSAGRVSTKADASRATVVMTMLPTGPVVRQVMVGDDGLLPQLRPGTLFIDTTSSPPDSTRELGRLLAQSGITMMDAGVSGGHRGAIEGNLVFMVGCDDAAAVERARPVLSVMSNKIFVLGGLGAGHTMKTINNFVSAAGFVAACEALVLGTQQGLDPATVIDVLNVSTGRNDSTERSMPKIIDGSFRRTFSLGLFTKDLKIAAELARENGVTAPLTDIVYRRMADAMAEVGPDVDHTAAYKVWSTQVRGPGEPHTEGKPAEAEAPAS